jgi:hypothetical protein
MDKGIKNIPIN